MQTTTNTTDIALIVERIKPLWAAALENARLTVTDQTHFFESGGHSLSAMILVARLEEELKRPVPLFELRNNPTPSALAKYLLEAKEQAVAPDATKSMDGSESQTSYLLHFNDPERQARRNAAFDKYYTSAMSSPAHAEFCRRVYGENFGQHGMSDLAQIDIMLRKLEVSEGDVVLDVGCGYGMISQYIAQKTGASVVGVDLSPSAIEYANTLAQRNPKLSFHVMDLQQLQFRRGTFSHIVSIDTIYYTASPRQTLQTFKEIGNSELRLGIIRTFPMRSFTKETWDPQLTQLASLLRDTFGVCHAIDFSKEENEHWRKKVEVLDALKEQFVREGNEEMFRFRYAEAAYETTIEQLRYLYLSGAGFVTH